MDYVIQKINPGNLEIRIQKLLNGYGQEGFQKERIFNLNEIYSCKKCAETIFEDNDSILCSVVVHLPHHQIPIKLTCLQVELRGKLKNKSTGKSNNFRTLNHKTDEGCTITKTSSFDFIFHRVSFPYDSFDGSIFEIKYSVKATLSRNNGAMVAKKIIVGHKTPCLPPEHLRLNKLSFGIQGMVGVDCFLNKEKFDLSDTIIICLRFTSVNIVVTSARLALVQIEEYHNLKSQKTQTLPVFEMEVLNGDVMKGDEVPSRIYLKRLKIPQTHEIIESEYSISYILNFYIKNESFQQFFCSVPIDIRRMVKYI